MYKPDFWGPPHVYCNCKVCEQYRDAKRRRRIGDQRPIRKPVGLALRQCR